MTGAVSLRAGRGSDAAAFAALHKSVFPRGWEAAEFIDLMENGADALVAEAAGKPAGFLLCRAVADEAEVLTLAVQPEFRRRGIALKMLEAYGEKAGKAGIAVLFLEVEAGNEAAIYLYEKAGFTRFSLRKAYYAGGGDAVMMRKSLAHMPGAAGVNN